MDVAETNQLLLERLSIFLNVHSTFITKEMVTELTQGFDLGEKEAYCLLLAGALGLNIEEKEGDRRLYQRYFPQMVEELSLKEYTQNPYYQHIQWPEKTLGHWRMGKGTYQPYEAFVYDDFLYEFDGGVIPQIGFFKETFSYPLVAEKGIDWMTVTPNEINTMKSPIQKARGKVCTFGLGLGYYPYMVSEKEEVHQVVIVEKEEKAIALFKKEILPQFPHQDKITIIHEEAFAYGKKQLNREDFDHVFIDLWHDPGDGREMYLKMKSLEKLAPKTAFDYWIEKTIKYYL